ncbi:MAG TPA: hypothetical protein VFL96_04110 [Acidobacteriaceae bacterium]|nr:hypothetical protein [Acidobacteriaceae bacterium]
MADKDMTSEQAIAAWDAGDPVWTVEMGGIGPGYEQAIQIMGFEFLRWMLSAPPKDGWDNLEGDAWREYRDACEAACSDTVKQIGPSGAQFGAAMNLASVFAKQGYAKGLTMVDADRHILVSKSFPALPESVHQ